MLKESFKQKIKIKYHLTNTQECCLQSVIENLLAHVKQRSLSPSSQLDSTSLRSSTVFFRWFLVFNIIGPKHLITKRYSIEACLVNSYVKACEIRDTKTLKMSRNIASLQVLG